PVVDGLRPGRVPGQAASLPEGGEALPAAGNDLVNVRLVAGVPQNDVPRRVENPVESQGQLDSPQVGTEVATGDRHCLDDELPDFCCQDGQFIRTQLAEIGGTADGLQ